MTPAQTMINRPAWVRRTLAVSVLFLAVASFWTVVVEPVEWLLVSQGEWRVEVRHELAQSRGRAGSEPALRKTVADLPSQPVWSRFFAAPAGKDVSAEVQGDILTLGSSTGVTVQALASLPKIEEKGLAGYGVRFTASMSAEQLRKFVAALRANARYLRVERLSVAAPQLQQPDQNALLTVTMEVFGYTRGSS